ncbi:membrane protein [Marinifilum sp. JC120]|nr:membrane protein [Marinifilum sp. JC120]
MQDHKYTYINILLLALLFMVSACVQTTGESETKAVKGYLDLSEWNFEKQGPATLDGEWEFYPNTSYSTLTKQDLTHKDFFQLPSIWKGKTKQGNPVHSQGKAAYRLKIKLRPDSIADSLYISGVLSACSVRVNGKQIGSSGTVGSDIQSEKPIKHLITPSFITDNGTVDIAIEVSNFHNKEGGINSSILLGSHDQIEDLINYRRISGAIIGGALLIMGIFHLVIFSMRRSSWENLYFGLFCLVWCIATIFNPPSAFLATQLINIDWSWYIKMCLLPTGLAIPLLLIFYNSLFPQRYGKQVNLLCSVISGLYCIYTIITPPGAYSTASLLYFILSRAAYIYLFTSFINDLRHKRKGAIYLAPGYLALFCAEFDEILFDMNIFGSADFTPYGTFIFILSYSLLMSARFAETLSSYEKVTGELEDHKKKEQDHKRVQLRLSRKLDSLEKETIAVNRELVHVLTNKTEEKKPNKRKLAVWLMNNSLECWEKYTGKSKAELASKSGIWNIYFEKDGYARTQTLDRYLSIETLPERPRWKNIYATAEFVISNCSQKAESTAQLEKNLSQLKKMS